MTKTINTNNQIQAFFDGFLGKYKGESMNGRFETYTFDVVKKLGFSRKICEAYDIVKDYTVEKEAIDGVELSPILIGEPGVYILIMNSKIKQAKEFKRWVIENILIKIYNFRELMRDIAKITLKVESVEELASFQYVIEKGYDIDGVYYTDGKIIAKLLGYEYPLRALRLYVDKVDTQVKDFATSEGVKLSKRILINESGIYSLILHSNHVLAEQFQAWLYMLLLPQIRQLKTVNDDTIRNFMEHVLSSQ